MEQKLCVSLRSEPGDAQQEEDPLLGLTHVLKLGVMGLNSVKRVENH
jgi:hypothetical protein